VPAKVGRAQYVRRRPEGAKRLLLPHDFTPRNYQIDVFNAITELGVKRAVCVWPRRHGKDLTWLHIHSVMSQKRVGAYWHLLPTYAQGKKSVWNAFRKDGKPLISNAFPEAMLDGKPNDSEMLLRFKNGSTFQLVGSDNVDSLVGAGPVGVSFSEFALSKPGSWDLIRPMLRENNGWAGFMSTPRGRNHFFKLFEMAKKEKWFSQFETIETAKAMPLEVIDEERREGMPEELIRQEFYCDFNAALVGSVFGDLMEKLQLDGRLDSGFEHKYDEVYTTWDLGIADNCAIWFWRVHGDGVEFVDHLEDHGKPLSFYQDAVDAKPFKYKRHYLPHDARNRTFVTGRTTQDEMISRYGAGQVAIVPSVSLADGIQAGRKLLQSKGTRFHPRVDAKDRQNETRPLEALRHYHYPWNEDEHVLAKKPLHDWSSHTADAFRYTGIVAKITMELDAPVVDKTKIPIPSMDGQFQLDELWAVRERERRYA
jgi:phage terminase large subunit